MCNSGVQSGSRDLSHPRGMYYNNGNVSYVLLIYLYSGEPDMKPRPRVQGKCISFELEPSYDRGAKQGTDPRFQGIIEFLDRVASFHFSNLDKRQGRAIGFCSV